jgi:hypothetical protein
MVVPLLTATSRRRAHFTWSCVSGKACRSSSRPSLARHPVLGRTAAYPTSLRLARQVWLRLVRGAQTHNSSVTTDAHGGANLHVMRKQQLAAMQATCPGRGLNTGLTSRATITSPSSCTLPHARLNPRHSSTFYDTHEPRLSLGRGELGKHSGRLRQAQTTRGEGQASQREQSNPATRRLPRQGITTRLQCTPTHDGMCQLPSTVTLFYSPLCPSS